jgi:hypothetical protein
VRPSQNFINATETSLNPEITFCVCGFPLILRVMGSNIFKGCLFFLIVLKFDSKISMENWKISIPFKY